MIWDQDTALQRDPPEWSLTGKMCLWADGSPAHVQQEPFRLMGTGWEAFGEVSRSTRTGTKYLAFTLRLDADVRAQWDKTGLDATDHIFVQLSNFMLLTDWYDDDLGVLYLK